MAIDFSEEPNPITIKPGDIVDVSSLAVLPGGRTPQGQDVQAMLDKKNDLYIENEKEWELLIAAYEGARALYYAGAIQKHERESQKNFNRRLRELYGFGYTRSIIDLFNFYLFKKEVSRDLGELGGDPLWKLFMEDCDGTGSSFDEYLTNQARYAAIYGYIGILIDKPQVNTETRDEELRGKVYPYCAAYHPPDILDWTFERNEAGRLSLTYLKVRDEDGVYRLWWPDRWEAWKKDKDEKGNYQVRKVGSGKNPLGEIPFVWLYNLTPRKRPIGISDVHDIARIDRSITLNLSEGEEIVYLAAFPMMRKPKIEVGSDVNDETGPSAILEFDPDKPQSKPDWLPAEVNAPITAIINWIQRKVTEIYRASNAGGMAAMEVMTTPKSGAALQAEFQMLNSTLVQKARNLEKAERAIVKMWLKWMRREDLWDSIEIVRARTYDVQDLAQDLADQLTSLSLVPSRTFQVEISKKVARAMLPAVTPEKIAAIDKEIGDAPEQEIVPREHVEFLQEEPEPVDRLNTRTGGLLQPTPRGNGRKPVEEEEED